MNYIIDGHNLIAQVSGLSLGMDDDEARLVRLLGRFALHGRHRIDVYFDGAPPGEAGSRTYGQVRAHFISHRSSADAAIRRRLKSLGRLAANWTLVTSDRAVQAAGREARARLLASEEFARQLAEPPEPPAGTPPRPDEPLSPAEIAEWEAIFKRSRRPKHL